MEQLSGINKTGLSTKLGKFISSNAQKLCKFFNVLVGFLEYKDFEI